MVGKVNEENVEAFKRLGITIGEEAVETEALAAVQAKFAGQADTYAKSTAGQMEQAKLPHGRTEKSNSGQRSSPRSPRSPTSWWGPSSRRWSGSRTGPGRNGPEKGPPVLGIRHQARARRDGRRLGEAATGSPGNLEQVANVVENTVRTMALALGIVIDLLGGSLAARGRRRKTSSPSRIRFHQGDRREPGRAHAWSHPALAEAAKAVGKAIFDAIWEGLGDLWQVGADIINWMLQGLMAMAWQIEQWVTNFAKGIIDKLDPREIGNAGPVAVHRCVRPRGPARGARP